MIMIVHALLVSVMAASAQTPAITPAPRQATPAPTRASIRQSLESLQRLSGVRTIPSADSVTIGGRTILMGEKTSGTVAIAAGTLDIYGDVSGNALAMDGDVVVHQGGLVHGDAVALRGKVRLNGGRVDGEIRSLTGRQDASGALGGGPSTPGSRAAVIAGWLVVLLLIGITTLVVAAKTVDGVVTELQRGFGRAFFVGVLAELALAPVLLFGVVGLALTLLGILLIPFAIVAYVLAAAGLLTLGVLGVARLTGAALTGDAARRHSATGVALRELVVGIIVLITPWFAAVAIGAIAPSVEWVARLCAVAIAWVAATAGFGATVLSRVGTRVSPGASKAPLPVDQYGWQTPTPVTGIAAARRPVSSGADR